MPKRTYQPSKIRRKRKFGFRRRSKTIIKRRRRKGRKKLTS